MVETNNFEDSQDSAGPLSVVFERELEQAESASF